MTVRVTVLRYVIRGLVPRRIAAGREYLSIRVRGITLALLVS